MPLSEEDDVTFIRLLETYGYTELLDAMSEHAHSEIAMWDRSTGPRDVIAAITSDLRRTADALEIATIDVRG
jgi:hypothetical protein